MVTGRYCDKFSDATHGMPQGVSLNAPYRFHWVKVVRVEGNTLHCTGAGQPIEMVIRREKRGREFVDLKIQDPIFGLLSFKTYPFNGDETDNKDAAEHLSNAERELRAASRALKQKG